MSNLEKKIKDLLVVGNDVSVSVSAGGRLVVRTGKVKKIYRNGFFDLDVKGRTFYIKGIYNIKPANSLSW